MTIRLFTRRRGKCGAGCCCWSTTNAVCIAFALLLTTTTMMLMVDAAMDDASAAAAAAAAAAESRRINQASMMAALQPVPEWGRCFPNNTKPPVPRHFAVDNVTVLTLEISQRITHQLFTHIFRIVLQEKLGYAQVKIVQYNDFDATTITERMDCYDRMKNMNAQSKVPTSMINVAVPVSPDFIDSSKCIKELGTVALPEYFGWFIPNQYEAAVRKYDSFWTNDSLNIPWTYFKDAKFVRNFQLADADEKQIKQYMYRDAARQEYQCNDTRCTNGKYIPDWCRDNKYCATLIAPDFESTSLIIDHINEMRVAVSVVWVGAHIETVANLLAKRPSRGFVIASWTPSDVVFNDEHFIAVAMKRCDYAINEYSSGCFYEKKRLAKYAWQDIQRPKSKEDHIFMLLREMNLIELDRYKELLDFYWRNRQRKTVPEIACEWVQNHHDIISREWLEHMEEIKKINIGGIFPITGSAYTGRGIMKGASMAVDAVNRAHILPPDMRLNLLVADGACRADKVMRAFIDYITNDEFTNLIGVLGPACSDTVEPLAGISKYYKTVTISYSAEGGLFSDRDKYPYFLRTIGENQHYKHVYLKFLNALGWKRVAALTEDGQKYTEYISHMQTMLENEGIKFISNEKFPRDRDKEAITKRLEKLKQDHARIIIADVFDEIARNVMCEAHKLKMTAKDGYVWFLPTWLNYTWYDTTYFNQHLNESVNCTTATMKEAINGYFAMAHAYFGNDDDLMQENITVRQWKAKYMLDKQSNSTSNYSGYAYDAVWVYALALQKLLKQDPEAIDHLHSSNNTNKLVDIIKHLDFNGVSGHIKFRGGPTRFSVINVMQWYNGNTHIVGKFFPNISDAEGKIIGGKLDLNKSAIVWLSNSQPADGPPAEQCTLHTLADFFGVSCQTALILMNIVCVLLFLVILGSSIFYGVKRNYDKKISTTNNYMKSLGLEHLLNSQCTDLDGWEVAKENVVLNRKLGEGAFGTVYGGEAQLQDTGWTGVAVKTLKMGSSTDEKLDFLSEAEVMKRFEHKNIVKLLGVCTKEEPVYTIMEFMLYGDLKTYLLARRHLVNGNDEYEEVSSKRLTTMALDVSRGLSYLASLKYVHRDIASRNCLISEQRVVKLCDFGMTRPVATYYRFNRRGMLPVRWMAPESLALGVFTTASDVWSYGVLLYEIITFGSFPYQGMSNSEVLEYVKRGNCLRIPHGVKGPLEALLKQCWSAEPKDRPAASEMVEYLANNSRLISPCLDVPISSVQTEDSSGPIEMQLPENFRKCSSSTSFKDLPMITNDLVITAGGGGGETTPMARHYPKRSVSEPDQCDSGISIQMENCCPKAPLLPTRSESISEGSKYAHISPQHHHMPMHDSPPQRSLEDVSKDYMPCSFVNGHAISKV